MLLVHDAIHGLHDHDGVVDDDADGEHHGEEGQLVDRVPERIDPDQRPQERGRHDQHGNDRGAQALQEDQHHDEDQGDRFQQRDHHVVDGGFDEERRVDRREPGHAGRK